MSRDDHVTCGNTSVIASCLITLSSRHLLKQCREDERNRLTVCTGFNLIQIIYSFIVRAWYKNT